ncbi:myb-like protein X [Pectinophora gossypiella]|uniref:CCHC-type domain-containing protein n=2 Tax=Pectinophora gossypiella TaxID=13191 RepID=A0A1E1WGP6_PECGO|nr:myb-like protein X [Pectinophora gossypiella]
MTRFARAKGSKSSNERTPEDGTPWEVMKEQLLQAKKESEESKKREEAEKQRIENYENFLQERKTQKRPITWCDFPEAERKVNPSKSNDEQSPIKKKKNKQNSETIETPEKKKNKKQNFKKLIEDQNAFKESKTEDNDPETSKLSKKKKNKNKHLGQQSEIKNSEQDLSQAERQKNKPRKDTSVVDFVIENDNETGKTEKQSGETNKKKQKKNKKQFKKNEDETNSHPTANNGSKDNINLCGENQNKTQNKKQKKNKLVDGKPIRRKEINDRSFQLIVNGKEIELVRFDGFPVMKRDAERLTELKNSMIKKGIPKSEVQRTMKLERRRAEKALARIKRDVCYNCRKGGHNLSDCPELKSKIPGVDAAEGVCFKCGSTEHRQFECKVQRDKEFRFATCFICKEQGHIARQCPDNPKGLYPNGGCCKLCGDVTHLRKDCPTANTKKEDTSLKLHTLDEAENIEDIGFNNNTTMSDGTTKKPKKIKF